MGLSRKAQRQVSLVKANQRFVLEKYIEELEEEVKELKEKLKKRPQTIHDLKIALEDAVDCEDNEAQLEFIVEFKGGRREIGRLGEIVVAGNNVSIEVQVIDE